MSKPTSVPGFGLLGRALFLIFCPVEATPIAKPGSPAPITAGPTLLGPPRGLAVVGVAVVLGAIVVVVVVVSASLSLSFFFQNFHPASTSTTITDSAIIARSTVALPVFMVPWQTLGSSWERFDLDQRSWAVRCRDVGDLRRTEASDSAASRRSHFPLAF